MHKQRHNNGNGGNIREYVINTTFLLFLMRRKIICTKVALVEKAMQYLKCEECTYNRAIRDKRAKPEIYRALLFALQDMQKDCYGRLFTEDDFPIIQNLEHCPECLQTDFDTFLSEQNKSIALNPTFVEFLRKKKLICSQTDLVESATEQITISKCTCNRALQKGIASPKGYRAILFAIQYKQRENCGRLFTEESFPPILNLLYCPEHLEDEFNIYLNESKQLSAV